MDQVRATERLREGQQPYDPINGIRVGAITGGLAGAALVAVMGDTPGIVVLACGLIGGTAGFWAARRQMRL